MKQLIQLTPEKFAEIYTSEEFRNQVAGAHSCYDSTMHFKHKATCSYPTEYIVTDEQITEAKIEIKRAKEQAIKDSAGKLVFVGMGMTYEPRYEDDVCNHRIRTEFTNAHGHKFFIEVGTGTSDRMRIDYAIDRENGREVASSEGAYNYKGLEHKRELPKYTKQEVLKLVNEYFDCNFSEIIIDNYNLNTDDYSSISPAFSNQTVEA